MLRETLLYLSGQSWLRRWMETSSASRRLTSRFVAGRTLDDALHVARQLASEQIFTALDCLGENVTSLDEAAQSRDSYVKALDGIRKNALPATVSIKLTQFGLNLSEEVCRNNVSALVACARDTGTRVEVDMESSEYTARTLRVVSDVFQRFGNHVRAVIQAYLYRSEHDIYWLSEQGIPVRLCKGAYREPQSVAFQQKTDVDRNFVKLMKILLDGGHNPGIATHDEEIVNECLAYVKQKRLSSDRFEFQMLFGIRRDLQKTLAASGFRLRSYVPYGDAWYPYFMRRLAERPANVLFLAKSFLRG